MISIYLLPDCYILLKINLLTYIYKKKSQYLHLKLQIECYERFKPTFFILRLSSLARMVKMNSAQTSLCLSMVYLFASWR